MMTHTEYIRRIAITNV